jgi:ADP-heptose:LPS heptosyltransferase
MVDRSCAFAFENNPNIDRFYYFDKVSFGKDYKQNKLNIFHIISDIWKILAEIRQTKFDLAIDLQGIERSAFFLYFCKAKQKFTKGNKPFLKGFKNADKNDHALTELRGTLKLADIDAENDFPKIYVQEESKNTLDAKLPKILLEALKNDNQKVILISPYTSWKTKDVSIDTWVKTAELIVKDFTGAQFIFCATPDKFDELEESLAKALTNKSGLSSQITNFAGKTNIQELLNLIQQSNLVLASEGATGHMASALDTPLAVVFGPTKPSRVGPWGDKAAVIQSSSASCLGCYQRKCDQWICMDDIQQQIATEAKRLLS